IGAYVPLGTADLAPYIGGGARWAATSYAGAHGNGLQMYAALGGIAGRLSSVQFRAQVEYFVNTFSTTETTYSATYTSAYDAPLHRDHPGRHPAPRRRRPRRPVGAARGGGRRAAGAELGRHRRRRLVAGARLGSSSRGRCRLTGCAGTDPPEPEVEPARSHD